MLQRRTDLAVEAHDLWKESAARETALPGVRARDDVREGCPVTRVEILDRQGAAAWSSPLWSGGNRGRCPGRCGPSRRN